MAIYMHTIRIIKCIPGIPVGVVCKGTLDIYVYAA